MKNFIIETPKISDTENLSEFFQTEIQKLWEKFPYPKENIEAWKDWHSVNELVEKIMDSERFFSIIRENSGKIIGTFESKPHQTEEKTHVVQWILVDENFHSQGIGSKLWYDFLLFCKEKWIKKVIILVHKDNIASKMLNQKFGATITHVDKTENICTLEKIFS